MDALERLEPVARPLLRQVDDALATLGAPAEHPIWGLLRRLRTTPADAVGFLADVRPSPLRAAADRLRERAANSAAAAIPAGVRWEGAAGAAFAVRAAAVDAYLHGEGGVAAQLRVTASYVETVADWCQECRDRLAHALAEILGSAHAVTLRARPGLGRGIVTEVLRDAPAGDALARAVLAAADIGVAVLRVAQDAESAGRDLRREWASRLEEHAFQAPAPTDGLHASAMIRLQH